MLHLLGFRVKMMAEQRQSHLRPEKMDQNFPPFYTWSIAQAWDWLTHIPCLGFVLLAVAGIFLTLIAWILLIAFIDMRATRQ